MHYVGRMKAPAGWFVVAYSSDLQQRGVTQLRYFGEPLLMFRAADGHAVVLGADHWFFDGIPYHRKVPRAAVRSWPVCERNGLVMVHFHPSRHEPTWEIPSLPEYNSPDWTPYVTRRWTLERDVATMLEETFATQQRRGVPDLPREEPNVTLGGADFRLRTRTEMDTPFGPVPGTLDIQSHGFGFSLVRFTGAVETLLITTVTPVDEEHVDARFTFTVKRLPNPDDTQAIEQRFVDELQRQVQLDLDEPWYATRRRRQREEPGASLRGWAQQFYV
jgi:hypothetical protein